MILAVVVGRIDLKTTFNNFNVQNWDGWKPVILDSGKVPVCVSGTQCFVIHSSEIGVLRS